MININNSMLNKLLYPQCFGLWMMIISMKRKQKNSI